MSDEKSRMLISVYDDEEGDINGYLDKIQNDKEHIDLELQRCIEAGGDVVALRAQNFNVYQLIEIRKGLQQKVDVNKYMYASIPWTEMEEMRKEMKQNIDLTKYRDQGFDTAQLAEIRRGLILGLDVSQYDKKEYFFDQMREIRLGLMSGIPVIFYQHPEYNSFQMSEIRQGVESGIDISVYASSSIAYGKMHVVRECLEDGLKIDKKTMSMYSAEILEQMHQAFLEEIDISEYIKKGYDAGQLEQVRIAISENLIDFDKYTDIEMRGESFKEIRIGLEKRLDVKLYAKRCYSYQQMRELRYGLEHQVDISYYSSRLYMPGQMKEIRLGLEHNVDITEYSSMIYTAKEMRSLRKWLETGRLIPEDRRIVFNTELPDVQNTFATQENMIWKFLKSDEGAMLDVSSDQMDCYITLPPVSKADTKYTVDYIMTILFKAHVRKGIDRDAITRIVQNKSYGVKTLVAKGKLPVDGEDGYYEYYVDMREIKTPKFDSEQRADYSTVNIFELVKAGDKVATYHSATKGEDGYTVAGKFLKAKGGKELPIIKGSGIMLLNDKLTYVATKEGALRVVNGSVVVENYKEIDDVISSSVEFDGSLLVKGDVISGAVIKCSGDLVIKGEFTSSKVDCGGDVIFAKGISGGSEERSKVVCDGNLGSRILEWCDVKCGKNIFTNECVNSTAYAEKKIIVHGNKGVICAGVYRSQLGVEAAFLGSRMITDTVINVGLTDEL
ncbi:MAG: FapA family protein, partial [Butyrivibrio sp.]|nr:FapA family protein [Butyrivibrio sp.]